METVAGRGLGSSGQASGNESLEIRARAASFNSWSACSTYERSGEGSLQHERHDKGNS